MLRDTAGLLIKDVIYVNAKKRAARCWSCQVKMSTDGPEHRDSEDEPQKFTTPRRLFLSLFFNKQDHQLKSSPAESNFILADDSDECVERNPLLKPSSRGPSFGCSQDAMTTY